MWGVNDFDEAANLPYTFDLVRLATSAGLLDALHHLTVQLDVIRRDLRELDQPRL